MSEHHTAHNSPLEPLKVFNLAQSRVRKKLMEGASVKAILDTLILTIEEFNPDILGSVLQFDLASNTLYHLSGPSISPEYNSLINGLSAGPLVGSCGTAAFTKQRVIVEDINTDPKWEYGKIHALKANLQASWSQPIFSSTDGSVLGTFAMYYRQPRTPTQAEIELLEAAADLAGTALEWKQVFNERQSFEEELKAANEELQVQLSDIELANQKLEASERKFRTLFEESNDAILLFDGKSFVDCNQATLDLLGAKDTSELRDKTVNDLSPVYQPDGMLSEEKAKQVVQQTLEQGRCRFEWVHKKLNGEEFWAEVLLTPLHFEKELLIHTVWRDISQRKRDEQELLRLNTRLEEMVAQRTAELEHQSYITQTITDNATGALFMIDANGCCTFMNPAAEEMTGFTLSELQGMPLHDAIHHTYPDGRHFPLHECPVDKALPQNNDVRAHEDVFIRKDGTFFPVLCAARPIKENGVAVGTLVEVRDITEEKKAQQAVMESNMRLHMMMEAIPQMAWTADPQGNVSYWNQLWYTYTGLSEEDSMRWGWEKVTHLNDLAHVVEEWTYSLETGEKLEVEIRLKNKEGNFRWHLTRAIPVRNAEHEVVFWVGTCTEIHEHKTTLEHLASTQEELFKTNIEISQKNIELIRINNDLDNFIYTASHDLKAPIANLEGLTYALKRELSNNQSNLDEIMGMIETSIFRFKGTIHELTEISKIQKNIDAAQEEVSFQEIYQDIEYNLKSLAVEAGASLQTNFEAGTIVFSKKNLRSVMYNLVSNAIKYHSPHRKAIVEISSRSIGNNTVLLSVKDNGLGLSIQQQQQVFSMFKRVHAHVEGSGVGLYIVKRIIENAGGSVELSSELNKGSEFRVYFRQ
jgi:PAS domain S-box-containing protein